ncbi:MAG: DUF1931 domain-containing protein [Nanoarchaeota archaeon]
MKGALVVRTSIKDVVLKYGKDKVTNVSMDFANELNKKVEDLIEKAVKRAEQNNRRTVQSRDL